MNIISLFLPGIYIYLKIFIRLNYLKKKKKIY